MALPARSLARVLLAFALTALLAACAPLASTAPTSIAKAQEVLAAPVQAVRSAAAEALVPATVAGREAVLDAVPAAAPTAAPAIAPAAVALIVRFEVTSPAHYTRALQAPVWPGGASGVTWGVGYDGGHQPRQAIARDWATHPAVLRLVATSGVIGAPAKPVATAMRDVRTPFPLAERVFASATLPAYDALTARTFAAGWQALPAAARGALDSLVYNRGAGMRGRSRAEMREIRDACVPLADVHCIAAQLRAMKRLWPDTPGLRDRREGEARLAESSV
jgi:GH24 family phage-related lysozyme (muramidase)